MFDLSFVEGELHELKFLKEKNKEFFFVVILLFIGLNIDFFFLWIGLKFGNVKRHSPHRHWEEL